MLSIEFEQLAAFIAVGIGMLLVGAFNLLFRNSPEWRLVGSLGLAGAAIGAVWNICGDVTASAAMTTVLAGAILLCLLAGSSRLATLASAMTRAGRHPAARWGALACVGLLTVLGSIVAYERADAARIDSFAAEMEELGAVPNGRVVQDIQAVTDRGQAIEIRQATDPRSPSELLPSEERALNREPLRWRVLRRQPADDHSNCHGWVFSAGRYWIAGVQVDRILEDNDYRVVETPKPGDLAVYRDEKNVVLHTAIVRYVTPAMPVIVEGKWGCIGVYLHAVEDSPYGSGLIYYRSPRQGHLLVGLGGPSPDVSKAETE